MKRITAFSATLAVLFFAQFLLSACGNDRQPEANDRGEQKDTHMDKGENQTEHHD